MVEGGGRLATMCREGDDRYQQSSWPAHLNKTLWQIDLVVHSDPEKGEDFLCLWIFPAQFQDTICTCQPP